MKKAFVLIVAGIALTACGGTVEAEKQSEFQSMESALEYSPHCESSCLCWNSPGKCGWKCVASWDTATRTTKYYNTAVMCNAAEPNPANYNACGFGSVTVECSSPCDVNSYSSTPCS